MKAIIEGEKTEYNKQLLAANSKTKTMWNIIKTETNRKGKTRFCNYNNIITHFRLYFFKLFTVLKLSGQSTNTLATCIQYS